MALGGQTPGEAASAMLAGIDAHGGNGGVIVVPASGAGVIGRTDGAQMNWGWASAAGRETHE